MVCLLIANDFGNPVYILPQSPVKTHYFIYCEARNMYHCSIPGVGRGNSSTVGLFCVTAVSWGEGGRAPVVVGSDYVRW